MSQPVLGFFQWLNDTSWSTTLREGDWQFGVIETIHILGLGFSVGTVVWIDLRLLDLAVRKQSVADVMERFEPWAIGGFIVMFISGFLLALAEPVKIYYALAFRVKVILLILAGINVLYFNKRVAHNVGRWGESIPWQAKMVAVASLVLWIGIIAAGRWTAYFSIY